MMTTLARGAAIGLALLASPATSQESTNQVATMTDWAVFTEGGDCWGVSAPRESTATRDGQPVQARRDAILMFVTFRQGGPAAGEISFQAGYTYADGSAVTVTIGGDTFTLFTEGQNAWTASAEEDGRLLEAMKAGADATVVGRSARGTETTDVVSLRGFTAAMEEAARRCAG